MDGSIPIKYGLRLNSDSKYFDFKKELSTLCGLEPNLMLVCELSNSQIRCSLPDTQKLKVSTATELFVYEIPKGDLWKSRTTADMASIEQGLKDIQRSGISNVPFCYFAAQFFFLQFRLLQIYFYYFLSFFCSFVSFLCENFIFIYCLLCFGLLLPLG